MSITRFTSSLENPGWCGITTVYSHRKASVGTTVLIYLIIRILKKVYDYLRMLVGSQVPFCNERRQGSRCSSDFRIRRRYDLLHNVPDLHEN